MNEQTGAVQDLGGLPSWYREIFPAGSSDGFYAKHGAHSVSFVDRGVHQLVISFDNLSDAGNPRYDREPWAQKFCADNGWSHMGVYAQGPTWFRDTRIIQYLEKLRDDGFFAQFERVTLCGTSMGGFAALAFCDLVPGANVVAFSPQSTLAEDLVPWENRFVKGRRQDWSVPYSDAATQTSRAGKIYLVYDPYMENDLRQVQRLKGENIVHLKCFWHGHKSAVVLRRMDQLKPVMGGAILGTLTAKTFYDMIRARKNIYIYRTNVEQHLIAKGRDGLLDKFRRAFKARRRANALRDA